MALKDIVPWRRETSRPPGTLEQLRREMNRLFDNFFAEGTEDRLGFLEGRFAPEIDLSETDKEICVSAELPGMEEKDIEVTIDNGSLSVRGELSLGAQLRIVPAHNSAVRRSR
jgi:HSP20 family protein